ncbi:hypothetical protein [Chryseobacterium luteum]|nr:hypothetical protein [Chryseobacterium luteum]
MAERRLQTCAKRIGSSRKCVQGILWTYPNHGKPVRKHKNTPLDK